MKLFFFLLCFSIIGNTAQAESFRGKWSANVSDSTAKADIAEDFTFYIGKEKHTLYNTIKGNSVVIFFNVECEHCISLLKKMTKGKAKPQDKRYADAPIIIINIGFDESSKDFARLKIPADWIVGQENSGYLMFSKFYNLRKYPCIFLINKDKVIENRHGVIR